MGERRGTKALELWCKRMVEDYGVRIDNMTHSWRDGIAFCALVCKCLSIKQLSCDLIHFDELKKENIYQNNDLAFRVAEEFLSIPSLLDPADFVAYETPDKLSILTYLSQFYQVFGAQENSLRLSKRSATEANKSSSSSSSSNSPAKMAYVPKREPCVVCNNPVFFAERLVIEDRLYHRTCLKCARCSTVLTLGSFYQTEKDNEFCCETCPDEEISKSATKNGESNRLSIAQRIALFERESSSVLKKSMSDEEKSKSLNRQLQSSTSPELSNFLSSQITKDESDNEEKSSSSSSEDSDDEKENVNLDVSDRPTTSNENNKLSHQNVEIKVSQNSVDITIADITTNDTSENNIQDDIELEFEKLAEEAVSGSFTPIIATPKKQQPKTLETSVNKSLEIKLDESSSDKKAEQISENIHEDNIKVDSSSEDKSKQTEDSLIENEEPSTSIKVIEYPEEKNPFGDDDEEEKVSEEKIKRPSLNPFGSCSEDDEEEKGKSVKNYNTLPKPPRPPPPKVEKVKPISTNPFDSDEDNEDTNIIKELSHNKTPIPTPRRLVPSITPEPSLRSNLTSSPAHSFKGSTSSLASSTDGLGMRRKKKKAPLPPTSNIAATLDIKSTENDEINKTPITTPKKKRPAPTPPRTSSTPFPITSESTHYMTANDSILQHSEDVDSNSLISSTTSEMKENSQQNSESVVNVGGGESQRRLIPLEESLIEDASIASSSSSCLKADEEVTYRRKIIPLSIDAENGNESFENIESIKDNKEAENRQRQSQYSLNDSMPYLNKSSHGKWKRRKGPAPALPGFAQPQKRVLQMLPLQEIRHELEIIEVQQQGLEKQGVMLEKMIRERCEGDNRTTEELMESLPNSKNPKEVEELILQLFELVNEKNELFRRQAELMYLRRAHRLEEEQADVEFEIRTLMAQPECNKTDSDKAREEALIARLVEIVQLRNEVVDCLEQDRQRAVDEDMSIKQRMESHTAKLDQEYLNQTPTKLSKKEKKKLKEAKKLKNKKLNDADKDLDTSEMKNESTEKKKKKKKFLF